MRSQTGLEKGYSLYCFFEDDIRQWKKAGDCFREYVNEKFPDKYKANIFQSKVIKRIKDIITNSSFFLSNYQSAESKKSISQNLLNYIFFKFLDIP